MKKYIDLLKKTLLFSGMTEDEILSMMKCLSVIRKEYDKGEYIYSVGDVITRVAMVLEGAVYIEREDYWGNNSILADISEGDMFGEVYAVTGREPVTINAIAARNCTVMMMDVDRIFRTCSSTCPHHAGLIRNLTFAIASKNKTLTTKMGYLSQRTTKGKLLAYLSEQSVRCGSTSFDIPFNRQQLADFLAVDRSAMSKELGKLKDEGVIDFSKNHFIIKEKSR